MTKWIHRMAVCTVVVTLASQTWAAPRDASPGGGGGRGRLERIILLQPTADAEVIRPFFALQWADGRQTVTTPRSARGRGTPATRAYTWTVDLLRGTYTTKLDPLNEKDQAMLQRYKADHQAEPPSRHQAGVDCAETGYDIDCDEGSGWWYLYAAETWEPGAYIGFRGLTRTEAEIGWSTCGSRLYLDGFHHSCWANASTFAATTWYRMGCTPQPPPSVGTVQLKAIVTGEYANWDFWDDDKATLVTEQINLHAATSWGFGYTQRTHSGEFAWLLSGREFETVMTRLSSCAYRTTSGGGGGGGTGGDGGDGGDGGGGGSGGSTACVPVYNGENGDYLGTCCGTTDAILDCAEGFLSML